MHFHYIRALNRGSLSSGTPDWPRLLSPRTLFSLPSPSQQYTSLAAKLADRTVLEISRSSTYEYPSALEEKVLVECLFINVCRGARDLRRALMYIKVPVNDVALCQIATLTHE
jgi:hypothetical protein